MRRRLVLGAVVIASCSVVTWTCAHRPSSAPGHLQGTLDSGGRTRTFISYRPDGPGPFPLVLALHGRLGTGAKMLELSNLTALAQQEHFIVVYPDGIERSWADGRGTSPASNQGVDDVAFLSALIDEQVRTNGADASRVFVVGMSNGGFMALTLACAAADKVTAVGSVTGFLGETFASQCAPSRPVSVALIAGDADPIVPFDGGALQAGRGQVIGAEATFETFAKLNRCAAEVSTTALPDVSADGTTVERRERRGCANGVSVRLDVVKGGGHTWPSGGRYLPERIIGKTSSDISASNELWRFFTSTRS